MNAPVNNRLESEVHRRPLRRPAADELRPAPDGDDPGPIASQDWFIDNLKEVLKIVPKEKIICALGSYGYDWTTTLPPPETRAGAEPGKSLLP